MDKFLNVLKIIWIWIVNFFKTKFIVVRVYDVRFDYFLNKNLLSLEDIQLAGREITSFFMNKTYYDINTLAEELYDTIAMDKFTGDWMKKVRKEVIKVPKEDLTINVIQNIDGLGTVKVNVAVYNPAKRLDNRIIIEITFNCLKSSWVG